MDFLVLTKVGGIFGVIVQLFGWIMDILFAFTNTFGIVNISLSIILFTLVTRIIMFPLSLNQQKTSKLSAVIQPEIQAIQKKYKGKTDNESMMKMNVETRAVYEKYGTSMTGGCLPLLIQFPLMIGLYQVIYKIPAYVGLVRNYFDAVIEKLAGYGSSYYTNPEFAALASSQGFSNPEVFAGNSDKVVDFLYKLTSSQWDKLVSVFPNISSAVVNGENAIDAIKKMQEFIGGINITYTPLNVISGFFSGNTEFTVISVLIAVLIPVLAGVSQWYSSKLLTVNQPQQDEEVPGANMMKSMNVAMPLMSLIFCFTFPLVIGIYWVVGSLFQMIQQVIMNWYMGKMDVDELVRRNVEKANKKREKKGLPPNKVTSVAQTMKRLQEEEAREEAKKNEKAEKNKKMVEDSNAYYNQNAKPGSLASKVNMVQKYNEKHDKH